MTALYAMLAVDPASDAPYILMTSKDKDVLDNTLPVVIDKLAALANTPYATINQLYVQHIVACARRTKVVSVHTGFPKPGMIARYRHDQVTDACQDAYYAGWEARERVATGPSAAGYPETVEEAWSNHTPPEHIVLALQAALED